MKPWEVTAEVIQKAGEEAGLAPCRELWFSPATDRKPCAACAATMLAAKISGKKAADLEAVYCETKLYELPQIKFAEWIRGVLAGEGFNEADVDALCGGWDGRSCTWGAATERSLHQAARRAATAMHASERSFVSPC